MAATERESPETKERRRNGLSRQPSDYLQFLQLSDKPDEVLSRPEHVQARLKEFHRSWADKVGPRDTALTPEQGGANLPYLLVLDLRAIELTDEQRSQISSDNGDL